MTDATRRKFEARMEMRDMARALVRKSERTGLSRTERALLSDLRNVRGVRGSVGVDAAPRLRPLRFARQS